MIGRQRISLSLRCAGKRCAPDAIYRQLMFVADVLVPRILRNDRNRSTRYDRCDELSLTFTNSASRTVFSRARSQRKPVALDRYGTNIAFLARPTPSLQKRCLSIFRSTSDTNISTDRSQNANSILILTFFVIRASSLFIWPDSRTCFTWQDRQPHARRVTGEVWLAGIDQRYAELTGDWCA